MGILAIEKSFNGWLAIAKNVFVPSERLWVKSQKPIWDLLFKISTGLIMGWLAVLPIINFLLNGIPDAQAEITQVRGLVFMGIYWAVAAASISFYLGRKSSLISKPAKVSFGGWHDDFASKVARKNWIIRTVKRLFFGNMVLLVLTFLFLSVMPRAVMTFFNLGFLG